MITKQQAVSESTFHAPYPSNSKCDVYRRNGETQTWKTRPDDFRIPTKFGLYRYAQITHLDAANVYAPADCPVCHGTKH